MDEPTSRIEKIVGELAGMRMLVRQLLDEAASQRDDKAAFVEDVRAAALAHLAEWKIGADTPDGAQRIRRHAEMMLTNFPTQIMGPVSR